MVENKKAGTPLLCTHSTKIQPTVIEQFVCFNGMFFPHGYMEWKLYEIMWDLTNPFHHFNIHSISNFVKIVNNFHNRR